MGVKERPLRSSDLAIGSSNTVLYDTCKLQVQKGSSGEAGNTQSELAKRSVALPRALSLVLTLFQKQFVWDASQTYCLCMHLDTVALRMAKKSLLSLGLNSRAHLEKQLGEQKHYISH